MTTVADELATTPAERTCLDTLRNLVGAPNGPIERHSLRVFLIAAELARRGDNEVDRELLLCAALLHDAGLYPGAATKAAYVTDGRELAHRVLADAGWPPERVRLAGDAVERHHELRAQWSRGAEVELLRRADLVEVSQWTIRFGLERSWLRALTPRLPRAGFVREVLRQLGVAARKRPATLWRIVFPG
jgi:HD superfamily phosphodiesterase